MIIIGIDNGLTGAIAVLTPNGESVLPAPTLKEKTKGGKIKTKPDEKQMINILERIVEAVPPSRRTLEVHAFVEQAQAMPIIRKGKPTLGIQGTTSAFNYGTGHGIWRGMLRALEIPYTLVSPRIWQKALLPDRMKDTKRASIITTKRLFKGINLLPTERCKVESHGMSDAVLLAEYGRRLLEKK